MRILTLANTNAPGQVSWVVDRDCLLMGAFADNGNAVMSEDPSLTAALWVSIPGSITNNTQLWHIYWGETNVASAMNSLGLNLKIPLLKDRRIFVACAASTYVSIALDDIVSAE